MSACEILSLYSEINQKCVDHGKAIGKPMSNEFKELTRIMFSIKAIF